MACDYGAFMVCDYGADPDNMAGEGWDPVDSGPPLRTDADKTPDYDPVMFERLWVAFGTPIVGSDTADVTMVLLMDPSNDSESFCNWMHCDSVADAHSKWELAKEKGWLKP